MDETTYCIIHCVYTGVVQEFCCTVRAEIYDDGMRNEGLLWYPSSPENTAGIACLRAYFSPLLLSRDATAATTTSGWLFAVLITAVIAIHEVPSNPKRSGASTLSTTGGFAICTAGQYGHFHPE